MLDSGLKSFIYADDLPIMGPDVWTLDIEMVDVQILSFAAMLKVHYDAPGIAPIRLLLGSENHPDIEIIVTRNRAEKLLKYLKSRVGYRTIKLLGYDNYGIEQKDKDILLS